MFSDIEGSTLRWERDDAAMAGAVRRHDELMRAAIESCGGRVFKTVGDAFCATFDVPAHAVAACLDAQLRLEAEDFSAVDGLHVRMALHTGGAVEREGDYFGPTVNRVARLLAIGHGGQVLLSGVTSDLVLDALPELATLADMGSHRLRDLSRPEQVYQLIAPALRREFPALRSLGLFPNNLPLESTPFVGRDGEVAEVAALLAAHRVVTLVGSGGVGKTRVSLHVGAQVLEQHRDGVWVVELAPVSEGGFIPEAIAAALSFRLSSNVDPLTSIVASLRPLRALLVLDNCEHLVADAAAVVAAIVRSCPDVRVLATSRQALGISGEAVYRMPSLPFPSEEEGASITAADARSYAAVELFVTRAEAADARFKLTDENAPIIAEICRRLDGIALAIELAAARVRILSPAQLRRRLGERFRVLTGGSRNALPRQQTLHAMIGWSYDLLAENERALLNRLAIFSGGWTIEAAEAVASGDGIDALEVCDLLSSLVDKSLVSTELGERDTRYRLLESTRSYTLEKLLASGEQPEVARRHAHWVAEFVDAGEETYHKTARAQWVSAIEVELDNARAAMTWALGERGDPALAARIATTLRPLWNDAGFIGEGRRWLLAAIARVDAIEDPRVVARLWHAMAFFSVGKQRVEAGERALEFSERFEGHLRVAACCVILVEGYRMVGRNDEAAALIDRALALYREHGKTRSKAYAVALDSRALLLHAVGRIDEARDVYAEAIALYESLGDEERAMTPRMYMADLEFRAGNVRHALECATDAIAYFHGRRNVMREANALANAAAYRLALGEIDEAEREARASLVLCEQLQSAQMIAVAIEHLAGVAAARGHHRHAARLSGYIDAWYERENLEREWTEQQGYERLVSALRANLAEEELRRYATEGTTLSEEDAMAEALAGAAVVSAAMKTA
ncbi:MAG TPA: adenylate/guanylate cyclase domain-containing protein [Candidatus Cybelea sp.]